MTEAARLTQAIRARVEAYEADGAAQWYTDEHVIDCDAQEFWRQVELALWLAGTS